MTNYFKGLDSIRAIAALVVVFGHIEALKKYFLIPNLIDTNFIIFPSAHLSVVFFLYSVDF